MKSQSKCFDSYSNEFRSVSKTKDEEKTNNEEEQIVPDKKEEEEKVKIIPKTVKKVSLFSGNNNNIKPTHEIKKLNPKRIDPPKDEEWMVQFKDVNK